MKNRGFTLLELLGVIVILALLTTLVFPSILNAIKKSSEETDKLSMDLINNAADLYIENHANEFPKNNGNKYIIEMKELIEDGNLPSNIKISDIDNIEDKCVQVTYINNKYSYELKNKGICSILPTEYQQVEYIESTGTQYLVIDYIASGITISKGKFQITDVSKAAFLFGSRTSGGTSFYGLNWGSGTPYKYYNSYLNAKLTDAEIDDEIHTFYKDKGKLYIDSTEISDVSQTNFTTPNKINIFGCASGDHLGYLPPFARIFYLQFYDNEELKIDLIPCYRKSDGVIGMYDLVEDKFYTNSGTGTFVKGKDV